jgi:hypothetical protein
VGCALSVFLADLILPVGVAASLAYILKIDTLYLEGIY